MTALDAALDGDAPLPLAYTLSRLCEEFGCVPSVAWRELDTLPVGLLDDLFEARYYARAKARVDAAATPDAYARLPTDELTSYAKLIAFERGGARLRHG